jgi:predicted transcriptional regulator
MEAAMPMGRPRTFDGPTTKVSVVVPSETARLLRIMAAEQGVSVAQLVDDWTHKARLLEAVERGRRAIAEGDFVSHEEAGRRLMKWSSQ